MKNTNAHQILDINKYMESLLTVEYLSLFTHEVIQPRHARVSPAKWVTAFTQGYSNKGTNIGKFILTIL